MDDIKGHRKRVIEKFKNFGFSGWYDYEILEMLLFYTIPRRDTKKIAKDLILNFKNFFNIINAKEENLKKIEGIGDYTVSFFKALKEFYVKLIFEKSNEENKNIIDNISSAFNIFRFLLGSLKEENIGVIYLDNSNKMLNYEIITKGTISEVFLYTRTFIERVLKNNAAGVIISHNHPTGEISPSDEDIDLTNKLKNSLELVDVVLLDHLIVSKTNYFSFSENNLL